MYLAWQQTPSSVDTSVERTTYLKRIQATHSTSATLCSVWSLWLPELAMHHTHTRTVPHVRTQQWQKGDTVAMTVHWKTALRKRVGWLPGGTRQSVVALTSSYMNLRVRADFPTPPVPTMMTLCTGSWGPVAILCSFEEWPSPITRCS